MKNTASLTIKRAGATLAIAGALLAMTGCTYTNNPATTLVYDASDGVSFTMWPKGQRVDMRNMLVISEGEGQPGRVLGTVYNMGETAQTVTFNLGDGQSFSVDVEPGESKILEEDTNEVIIDSTPEAPGLIIEAEGVIGETTEAFSLPVLNGDLEEYAEYLPGGAQPTAEATASSNH
ncbi:hypothetical protein [Rothia nasimurium]|uniref:hypothetical protein n=1 Tax=Rothia nasimurium TaxID=85336 RepID=UPI003BA195F2